jgi:hypothetical protein
MRVDDRHPRKPIVGKPVDGKPADDSYKYALCGARIEYRDLGKLLAHEEPLLHPAKTVLS